jgi:ketosteroid isomerase-like protein
VTAPGVRQPLATREGAGRTLDQRIQLRFPRLVTLSSVLLARLPSGSRVRKAALKRTSELVLEAFNRRDLAATMVTAHPAFEYHPNREWVEAGLVESCYRGLAEYRRYVETVDEVWGGQNFLMGTEVIDLGDRFVVFAKARMRAQASGVWLNEDFALVVTLNGGRATAMQEYYDHAQALAVVGLAPS